MQTVVNKMRGMKNKTLMTAFACLAFCMSAVTSKAQVELLNMTNTSWSYLGDGTDLTGTDWTELAYTGDASWPTGLGLFGVENDGVYPVPIATPLTAQGAGGPTTDYFRVKFMYDGSGTANSFLRGTIHIDDGYIMYLNGVEIDRFNMPDDPIDNTTQATDANPGGEPVTEVVFLHVDSLPTPLIVGENVIAVELHQAGTSSSDKIWGMQLDLVEGAAPVVTSPTEDQILNVVQGASADLTVEATGLPAPDFQWEFSTDSGATFNPLDGETSATYTIDFMASTNVGLYRVIASSTLGSAISPVFDVRLQEDVIPPTLVSACVETNGTLVRTVWSEAIGEIFLQPFVYAVVNVNDHSDYRNPISVVVDGNEVLLVGFTDPVGAELALEPGVDYIISFVTSFGDAGPVDPPVIADLFGNGIEPNVAMGSYLDTLPAFEAPVSPTVSFQEGVNDYFGTLDTEIRGNNATLNGSELTVLNPDGDDGGTPVNALVRFENIFGSEVGQIPPGATIVSATLNLYTTDGGQGSQQFIHRMLIPWVESDNWNTLGQGNGTPGIQADGVEAAETATGTTTPTTGSNESFDVTADLQAFVTEGNNGWVIIPGGTDGWDLHSSESGTLERRPSLTVCYAEIACTDVPEITSQPMSATVDERDRLSLSVIAICGETYQWRKDGVDISGATGSSLVIDPALPSDSGMYDVMIGNSFGTTLSDAATVVVNADVAAPTLDSVVADGDAGTITLSFSEPMALGTAQDTGNYTISVVGGGTLAVNSAVLQANGTDVVLTTDLPSFDSRYTLDVTGLLDTAVTPNSLAPYSEDLVIEYLILDWDATWTYTTNGQVEATVPGWEQPGYDDSAWLTGAGLFGLETSGGTPIPMPPGIQTPFTLEDETAAWIHTFYFRTLVNVPIADTSDVTFEFRHLIDDGAVAYIGGQEAFRYNMPEDVTPVTYSNEATDAIEASLQTDSTTMPSGDSLVAIEVHQGNVGSSDVLFGTRIVALVGQEFIIPGGDVIEFTYDGTDLVLTWDDSQFILLSAPSVEGPFTEVVGATSPHTVTPVSGMEYFALGEAP